MVSDSYLSNKNYEKLVSLLKVLAKNIEKYRENSEL